MATTIFPQTDDFGDPVLGQSMAALINRGADDPLAGFTDTTQDTTRLQYYGTTANSAVTSSVGDWEAVFDVDVDVGEIWYYECFLTISDVDNADPGDRVQMRITPPAGVNVRGFVYGIQDEYPTTLWDSQVKAEGSAQIISTLIRAPNVALVKTPIMLGFIIAGDSGGGNVLIEIAKELDTHANNYRANDRFLIGHRIM